MKHVYTLRLASWAVLTTLTSVGCSGANSATHGNCDPILNMGPPSLGDEPNDDLAAQRLSCGFKPADMTSKTIGSDSSSLKDVAHVVVVMLENRSFDHYLSDLPSVNVDADVAGADDTNPGLGGRTVTRFHSKSYCLPNEVGHEWSQVHLQLNAGKKNGFVATGGDTSMAYYTHEDLPVLYRLASQFATSDRYFSPLLGPTWPNRLFFFAGTSCGYAEGGETNANITADCGLTHDNVFKQLKAHGVSTKVYDQSGVAAVSLGLGVSAVPASYASFVDDAQKDRLPAVAWVGASTGELPEPAQPKQNDDHPPANVQDGERFLFDLVQTLASSPAWKSTVLFITYDEHGGFYDHVTPPHACEPDGNDSHHDFDFNQYGFRVPLLVVSPFAKRHYVSHADADHTSITRFIEHWQQLPALSYRDANAWPLLDAFDFEHPNSDPPELGDRPTLTACAAP